jgi:hypothetical protein
MMTLLLAATAPAPCYSFYSASRVSVSLRLLFASDSQQFGFRFLVST